MKPSTWADALHVWGLVVLGILVFIIMTGLPFSFAALWKC